ncbi:MAG: sensor histidine kinase [Bacteroidia bacterium]
MKLLNKTSIYYLLFALPVFAICSGLLYYFISSQIIDNLDESLVKEKNTIELNLKKGESIHDLDDEVFLKEINSKIISDKLYFSNSLIYDSTEAEFLPYRILQGYVTDGKKNYEISIRSSYIESDDLITSILLPVIILFVVLLLGFFFINWFISKKLWSPFYHTVERLNHYKIDEPPAKFETATIKEFSELNTVLTSMTEKIYRDFKSQKQFIENASHEIQTPLAVIKSKIEILIQSSSLSENDMQIIQSVYNASNKLSLLNKGLLLLSKIENNQFIDLEKIQIKQLIEKTLQHFEDLISIKNIRLEKNYLANPVYQMNPVLADILMTNLIQNAIRHNIENGFIKIELTEKSITISNSSAGTAANTNELFERFKKSDSSAESIGLGLAIVKEICENFNIKLSYRSENSIHTLTLSF